MDGKGREVGSSCEKSQDGNARGPMGRGGKVGCGGGA